MADTLDYKKVAKRVLAFIAASEYKLVETLAHRVALLILEEFGVAWVRISLNKPGAIRNSRDVGVTIERTRADLPPPPARRPGPDASAAGLRRRRQQRRARDEPGARGRGARARVSRRSVLQLVSQPRRWASPGRTSSTWSRAFDTQLPVDAVLAKLHAIESACGRPRGAPRWAPRSMDLDVLLYGDLVCDEPGLKLPRPDLLKRAYMLGPLAQLAPQVGASDHAAHHRRAVAPLRPVRPSARARAGRRDEAGGGGASEAR